MCCRVSLTVSASNKGMAGLQSWFAEVRFLLHVWAIQTRYVGSIPTPTVFYNWRITMPIKRINIDTLAKEHKVQEILEVAAQDISGDGDRCVFCHADCGEDEVVHDAACFTNKARALLLELQSK